MIKNCQRHLVKALHGDGNAPSSEFSDSRAVTQTEESNASVKTATLSYLPNFPAAPMDTVFARRSSVRILLAEDNLVNQKVALMLLKRMGYQADVVCNGLQALEALNCCNYDIVLMDVNMPEMDGLEATRRICQEWLAARPTIIAVTANKKPGDRAMCLAAGMDDYISKPICPEELERALHRCELSRANCG